MVRSLCLKAEDKLFLIDVVKEKLFCLMLVALCENLSGAASCTGNGTQEKQHSPLDAPVSLFGSCQQVVPNNVRAQILP